MQQLTRSAQVTIGLDLGDKITSLCALDTLTGEVLEQTRIPTTTTALHKRFADMPQASVALETGTHSPWVSRLLKTLNHDVLVANARAVRLIYANTRKNDQLDAHSLARLARLDPNLLASVQHRSEDTQADLALLRARAALIRSRTQLVNHARGSLKSFGVRVPKHSPAAFVRKVALLVPNALKPALEPILAGITGLNSQVKALETKLEDLALTKYPVTRALRQVRGVGLIVALAFVLTIENPQRFEHSRSLGAYLGLVPARDQSGEFDAHKRISKAGDTGLRTLLVQSASFILGPFGGDGDLRRHGEGIAARGGAPARRRALVAVARKLAVLLHRLWVRGEVYEPLRNTKARASVTTCAAAA